MPATYIVLVRTVVAGRIDSQYKIEFGPYQVLGESAREVEALLLTLALGCLLHQMTNHSS